MGCEFPGFPLVTQGYSSSALSGAAGWSGSRDASVAVKDPGLLKFSPNRGGGSEILVGTKDRGGPAVAERRATGRPRSDAGNLVQFRGFGGFSAVVAGALALAFRGGRGTGAGPDSF